MELNNPVKPNYLSTIIMHLDYNFYNENLKELFLKELQNGNLYPLDYAMMLDRMNNNSKNKEKMLNYIYLGTYDSRIVKDTLATNEARKLIGLPKIKKN